MKILGTDIEINTYDDDRFYILASVLNDDIQRFYTYHYSDLLDHINGMLSSMSVLKMIPWCYFDHDGVIHITVEN